MKSLRGALLAACLLADADALLLHASIRPAPSRPLPRASLRLSQEEPAPGAVDKQLSGDLMTFGEMSPEFQELSMAALKRLDKFRAMSGKPKYETVDGMIEQYMAETAERGMNWTREEAESEVCRYLQRQALADEGGVDGDGQDKAAFGMLAGLLALVGYATATIVFPGGS